MRAECVSHSTREAEAGGLLELKSDCSLSLPLLLFLPLSLSESLSLSLSFVSVLPLSPLCLCACACVCVHACVRSLKLGEESPGMHFNQETEAIEEEARDL